VGATKRPSYRVVAIDSRRPRDGRALEILGFYNPLTDPATVQIDADRLKAWIDKGASPSETVVKLMKQAGIGAPAAAPAPAAAATRKRAPAKPRAAKSGATKATAESAAAAEPAPAETASSSEVASAAEGDAAETKASE
jgi:small subunit ribosomal protein S16